MRSLLSAAIHLAGSPVLRLPQRAGGEAETNTGPMVFEWVVRAFLYIAVPLVIAGLLWYVVRRRSR